MLWTVFKSMVTKAATDLYWPQTGSKQKPIKRSTKVLCTYISHFTPRLVNIWHSCRYLLSFTFWEKRHKHISPEEATPSQVRNWSNVVMWLAKAVSLSWGSDHKNVEISHSPSTAFKPLPSRLSRIKKQGNPSSVTGGNCGAHLRSTQTLTTRKENSEHNG